MDRLATLSLFTRIIETGSFTRAADGLDIPRPTATNAIKALETRLGVRLLERSTRHVRPTLDGQAFYDRCVHVLAELDDAEASLRQVASRPRGRLRVDLHGTHATQVVLPRIAEFRGRYPELALDVSSGDRLVDLVREGVDCVVRAGNPRDSNLVARPLARMPQVLCASPDYLARAGTPAHPDELAQHSAVRFFASSGGGDYPITLRVDDAWRDFTLPGWMAVNDAENYVVCAVQGCGLVQVPRFHVEDELRDGRLVQVLPAFASPELSLWAMYPYRRHLSPRVRVFVEWVGGLYAEKFGPMEEHRA
jgi:DNA-binding transcriptional LysR family regulator